MVNCRASNGRADKLKARRPKRTKDLGQDDFLEQEVHLESAEVWPVITPFEQRLAPLDLYVGHLGEEAELIELCPQGAAVRLALGDAALVRSCLERAFHGADPAEFAAKGRIARDYFSHRDSWPEHSRIFLVRGEPVGVCLISQRFYYSQERAYPYVDVIAVDPSLRRQGLGQTLLRMSMRSLWAEGHRSIIHAHIRRGNVGSESLFRGCDFLFWRRDDD